MSDGQNNNKVKNCKSWKHQRLYGKMGLWYNSGKKECVVVKCHNADKLLGDNERVAAIRNVITSLQISVQWK